MPSFNGNSTMFGIGVQMRTEVNDRAAQTNAYPSLSGLEELDQGLRGMNTFVEGRLYFADIATLNGVVATWMSYFDGQIYTLVDIEGNTYSNVKLEKFSPELRAQRDIGTGYATRRYSAVFKHLTSS